MPDMDDRPTAEVVDELGQEIGVCWDGGAVRKRRRLAIAWEIDGHAVEALA